MAPFTDQMAPFTDQMDHKLQGEIHIKDEAYNMALCVVRGTRQLLFEIFLMFLTLT